MFALETLFDFFQKKGKMVIKIKAEHTIEMGIIDKTINPSIPGSKSTIKMIPQKIQKESKLDFASIKGVFIF